MGYCYSERLPARRNGLELVGLFSSYLGGLRPPQDTVEGTINCASNFRGKPPGKHRNQFFFGWSRCWFLRFSMIFQKNCKSIRKKKQQRSSPDYWALHPTTGLGNRPTTGRCTRMHGFAPDCKALQPTTGLCPRRLGFHPNTRILTQIPKSSHSTDQCTLIGHFPLDPGPLSMAYSHTLMEPVSRICDHRYHNALLRLSMHSFESHVQFWHNEKPSKPQVHSTCCEFIEFRNFF